MKNKLEILEYKGTKEDIYREISQDLNKDDCSCNLSRDEFDEFFRILLDDGKYLLKDEDGEFLQVEEPDGNIHGVAEFITEDMNYYISLKNTTIFLLIFLATRQFGDIVGFLTTIMGIPAQTRTIHRIDKWKGEKCLLLELQKMHKKGSEKNPLKRFKGVCCNNHLPCQHREDEKCKMTEQEIDDIMHLFEELQIVKKKWNKYYCQI